tara:strand:- start:10490 stop:11593 length:1104 start_codon:yes stop_codon:yes gene_type:complete
MESDTFTMENVKAFELGSSVNNDEATPEEPQPEAVNESSKPEPSSFADAFKRATEGEPEDPQPAEEKAPEPERAPESESRSASDFKSLKAERDSAKAELEKLRQEMSELKNNDVDAILESTKKERDEMSELLKLNAIEKHPEFRKKFNSRIDAAIEQARQIVGSDDADRVEKLIRMEDSEYRSNALEEVFSELSTSKSAIMGAVLQQVGAARAERAAALADSEATYNSLMESQSAEQKRHIEQSSELFDGVAKQAISHLDVFQTRDGDDEDTVRWNKEVNDRLEHARNIFIGDTNSQQDLAQASLWAAAGPKYRELLAHSLEINRKLREQNGLAQGVTPSVTGKSESSNEDNSEKSFLDAFRDMTGS